MQERIYTLKKGTEVPAQFDGVTIPFQIPSTFAEIIVAAGGTKADADILTGIEASLTEAARKNAVAVFNQAHALNIQKNAKEDANEADDKGVLLATVQSVRDGAAGFKYGQVRVRGASTGTSKPRATQVANALGEDFLAMLTPEQRALYDAKMAALSVKSAAGAAKLAADKAAEKAPTKPKK